MTNKYGGYNVEEFNKIFKYVSEVWIKNASKKKSEVYGMNENMLNMLKELDSEFPDNYGLREGLRIDAIDLKDRYDDCIDFDEELLDEVRIYYKNKTILIKCYDRDNWEIEDEDYIKFEDFREIGKILSIVMKHISRIELI